MKYSFNNFQFDSEQQILTRDGKVITLNEKPAKLLTLLLLEPHKVHNKNVILEYVWPDRVISEQVVFQNISYLRALFGNASIKTFVKKGYQWQFQLKKIEEASDDIDIAEDVGIAFGFNNIPRVIPPTLTVGGQLPVNKLTDMLRQEVALSGFVECLCSGLISRKELYDYLRVPFAENTAV